MAHFAQIDKDNIVQTVIVSEQDFIDTLDDSNSWIQTSYNTRGGEHTLGGTPLRKNYAGIGFTYDRTRDAFIPPQPFQSWVLDENTCLWNAPIAIPIDGNQYIWDESTTSWVIEVE